MKDVDPSGPASGEGLFGLDVPLDQARYRVIPVPFEATTSFRRGTARGPEAILTASHQVELLDLEFGVPWEAGIALADVPAGVVEWNAEATELADRVRAARDSGGADEAALRRVNELGAELNDAVEAAAGEAIDAGSVPVVLGGDHSVPLGAWKAAGKAFGAFGILHFDAHADLRYEYEGFTWSHASVMNNALHEVGAVREIAQIGLRDVCAEELGIISASEGRVRPLFDSEWVRAKEAPSKLRLAVRKHLAALPERVWISFDVDGLDPSLCPNTGTPVPGGLGWHDAALWLSELAHARKHLIGADLVEVAPGTERPLGEGWDETVGARLLYRLIGTLERSARS